MAKVSWQENMRKQYGNIDEWINYMTPENIQRNANRVVRDIVKGNVNYEVCGNDFLNSKFMENIRIAIISEFEKYSLYYNALVFYANTYPAIPNIGAYINELSYKCYIYNTVLQRLEQVKSSGNIGYLADISSVLYQYRNFI